jgi:hypothetical protein
LVAELGDSNILPPLVAKSSPDQSDQPVARKSSPHRLTINFSKHAHLGWTHYRILLSVEAGLKRGFYFEQAGSQRWSKRELQHQIERALFDRVALSRDTRALVRLEKQRGPVETVRYEDAFKDPYLLDFLGLNVPNCHPSTPWPSGARFTAGCWSKRRRSHDRRQSEHPSLNHQPSAICLSPRQSPALGFRAACLRDRAIRPAGPAVRGSGGACSYAPASKNSPPLRCLTFFFVTFFFDGSSRKSAHDQRRFIMNDAQ